ncbi:MAG: hypothetical protein N3C61_01945 [Candidatus Micrarchaeota archaeon]|nr:hypothetical protein [Candidatus Micrarchaeota archaeon]
MNNYVLYISNSLKLPNLPLEFSIIFLSSALLLTPTLYYLKTIIGKKKIIILSLLSFLAAILITTYGVFNHRVDMIIIGAVLNGVAFSVLFSFLNSIVTSIDQNNFAKHLGNMDIIWVVLGVLIPVMIIYIDLNMYLYISVLSVIGISVIVFLVWKYFDDEALKAYRTSKSELRNILLISLILLGFLYGIINLEPVFVIFTVILYTLMTIKNLSVERLRVIDKDRRAILFFLLIISTLIIYIPINLGGWIMISYLKIPEATVMLILSINTLLAAVAIKIASEWLDRKDYDRVVGIGTFNVILGSALTILEMYVIGIVLISFGTNMIGPIFIRKILLDVPDERQRDKNSTDYMFVLRIGFILSIKLGYILVSSLGLGMIGVIILISGIIYYLVIRYRLFPAISHFKISSPYT